MAAEDLCGKRRAASRKKGWNASMANGLLTKLFGNYSKRELKRIQPLVDQVLGYEEKYKKISDEELKSQTSWFKERLAQGETLDGILPEAFAACREAMARVLSIRLFPVQVQGGIILHQGRIAEMKTGEGKTFTLALPAYLNALTGKGVHIVTVNEYLAKYQGEMMARVFNFMGLTVGLAMTGMSPKEKKAAYACDITYGTNNEMGFDYLRDNMVTYKENKVQRGHNYAIVDEVDSILIDEARTPLIISGKGAKADDLYGRANAFARGLKPIRVKETDEKEDNDELYKDYDYIVNEKLKTCSLTRRGVKKAEEFFGVENLTDPDNIRIQHHVNQAIKAWGIMHRDQDYVVKDGEVIIVDEFTGRLMYGRRYNEGLHQAIEAKEGVEVARESRTLATITFQNYFRLYDKLSGMTGTAMTEQEEFSEIYKLDVVEIPTNRPMIREDCPDVVYKTEQAKYKAVIDDIVEHHQKGQPVLVGTITIEKSELLSKLLKARGVKHQVLNAKFHEKEAQIVAQAGRKGAVTIATNMAGRGTDILLGGNAEFMAKAEMRKMGFSEELLVEATAYSHTEDEAILEARKTFAELNKKYKDEIAPEAEEVRALGGLYIIGTERHESRRIDNQLRGRAGRQGDPGKSRFYISLEDDLMRLFGGERLQGLMDKLKIDDDTPIEAGHGLQLHRERPAQGGKPQLRHPQERAPVRRGDEQPAADHLQPARPGAQRREHEGANPEDGVRRHRAQREAVPARERPPRGVGYDGPAGALHGLAHRAGGFALYQIRDRGPGARARGHRAEKQGRRHLPGQRGGVHLPHHAGGGAGGAAAQRGPGVDGPHRRHGAAAGRHPPACLRQPGPCGGVPHRGL